MKKLLKIIGIILVVLLFLLLIGFFKKPVKPDVIGGYGSHNPPEWVTEQKTWEDEMYDITGEVGDGLEALGNLLEDESIADWNESKIITAKFYAKKVSSGYQKGRLLNGEGYRFEQWLKAMGEFDKAMYYFNLAIELKSIEAFDLTIEHLDNATAILDGLSNDWKI